MQWPQPYQITTTQVMDFVKLFDPRGYARANQTKSPQAKGRLWSVFLGEVIGGRAWIATFTQWSLCKNQITWQCNMRYLNGSWMVSSIMIKNNSNDSNHLYIKEDFGFSPGWWFQTWILCSIIYGMSFFPLTNSYFSRCFFNHQLELHWITIFHG